MAYKLIGGLLAGSTQCGAENGRLREMWSEQRGEERPRLKNGYFNRFVLDMVETNHLIEENTYMNIYISSFSKAMEYSLNRLVGN